MRNTPLSLRKSGGFRYTARPYFQFSGDSYADLRVSLRRMRVSERVHPESLRPAAHRLSAVREGHIQEAADRRRLPAEGLRLVRDRLQGWRSETGGREA